MQQWTVSLSTEKIHRILSIAKLFNIKLKLTENLDGEIVDKSFTLAIYNYEAIEDYFPNTRQQNICEKGTVIEMGINYTDYLH